MEEIAKRIDKLIEELTVIKADLPKQANTPEPPSDGSYTIRMKGGGNKVYLVKDNTFSWVKNPYTLNKLGFSLGNEKFLSGEELAALEKGEPLDLMPATPEPPMIKMEEIAEAKVLTYRKEA